MAPDPFAVEASGISAEGPCPNVSMRVSIIRTGTKYIPAHVYFESCSPLHQLLPITTQIELSGFTG